MIFVVDVYEAAFIRRGHILITSKYPKILDFNALKDQLLISY